MSIAVAYKVPASGTVGRPGTGAGGSSGVWQGTSLGGRKGVGWGGAVRRVGEQGRVEGFVSGGTGWVGMEAGSGGRKCTKVGRCSLGCSFIEYVSLVFFSLFILN